MTKREILLSKMCEVFAQNNEFYSLEYSMDKALELAENFLVKSEVPEETVSYAHRALVGANEKAVANIIPFIRKWLLHDTSIQLRKTITPSDCEKLAVRLSILIRD